MPKPHECPEGERFCPDCNRCRPLSAFRQVRAKDRPSGYRYEAYCTEHQRKRSIAYRRQAPPDSRTRQSQRAAQQRYYERNKETPEFIERRNAASRVFRQRHPDRTAETYRSWVERNTEKRDASRRAWRIRQQMRSLQRAHRDPALDPIRREIAERDREIQSDE